MRFPKLLPPALSALVLAGCVADAPKRDALAGIASPAAEQAFGVLAPTPKAQGRYKSLSVGVILSENSLRSEGARGHP